jgi:hypothetical protein
MAVHVEPGVRHNVRNISTTEPLKELVVLMIEQGKPTTIPSPAK